MSATAIKISATLAEQARETASHADRSLTGQVEHWARIGHAVEPLLSAPAVAALKKCGGDVAQLDDPAEIARVLEVMEGLRKNPPYAATADYLMKLGTPVYEANPADPEGVIQTTPDGTKTPGRFVNRVFVPSRPA